MCSMCSPFRSPFLTFSLLPSPYSLVVIEADLSQGHCTSGHGFTHRDSIQPTHTQLRWQIKDTHSQTHTHFDVLPRLMNGGNGASVFHGCVVRAPTVSVWVCTGGGQHGCGPLEAICVIFPFRSGWHQQGEHVSTSAAALPFQPPVKRLLIVSWLWPLTYCRLESESEITENR